MEQITKYINSDKSYKIDVESIPDVTTDNWFIKGITSNYSNFSFTIEETKKSFSFVGTDLEDGAILDDAVFTMTIGFKNNTGPKRTDRTVNINLCIVVRVPQVPFIIKNSIESEDILASLTWSGSSNSINLIMYTYIADIGEEYPDISKYTQRNGISDVIIPTGKALYIIAPDNTKYTTDVINYYYFKVHSGATNKKFELDGDMMALLKDRKITQNYTFYKFFNGCTGLTSIPEGLLPATTLTPYCYNNMFNGCTGLTSIPEGLLPATTLANNCYDSMFYGCTGLTSIPEGLLPATTLAVYCYRFMFGICSKLDSIPSGLLPATTLASNCWLTRYSPWQALPKISTKHCVFLIKMFTFAA